VSARRSHRILLVDDRAPNAELGAGFPRAALIVRLLAEAGHRVSVVPMRQDAADDPRARELTHAGVEFVAGFGADALRRELGRAQPPYDIVWVSRPHNMKTVGDMLSTEPALMRDARLIYDAEALFSTREVQRLAAAGAPLGDDEISLLYDRELEPARLAETVLAVSQAERTIMDAHGVARSAVLSYGVDVGRIAGHERGRDRIAFLGSLHSSNSPNAEAVRWFAEGPLRRLRDLTSRPDLRLTIVGLADSSRLTWLADDRFEVRGVHPDLRRGLRDARILVVPTRTGAGIPLKVLHGAALGIPMVVTSLVAGQLGWLDGREVLVADHPDEFAEACLRLMRDAGLRKELRGRALERVREDFSTRSFQQTLSGVLSGTARP
jgi:glycosyltransferase involved in cell wall biosynthesis